MLEFVTGLRVLGRLGVEDQGSERLPVCLVFGDPDFVLVFGA